MLRVPDVPAATASNGPRRRSPTSRSASVSTSGSPIPKTSNACKRPSTREPARPVPAPAGAGRDPRVAGPGARSRCCSAATGTSATRCRNGSCVRRSRSCCAAIPIPAVCRTTSRCSRSGSSPPTACSTRSSRRWSCGSTFRTRTSCGRCTSRGATSCACCRAPRRSSISAGPTRPRTRARSCRWAIPTASSS